MPTEADNLKAYSESCSNLRHYSNASFAIRAASILQGFAILIPWVNALPQKPPSALPLIGLPLAGIFFTVLLYVFYRTYYKAAGFFYEQAAAMERTLFDENFRPMDAYNSWHDKLYSNFIRRLFTLDAPFVVIGTFCGVALTISFAIVFPNLIVPRLPL